MKTYLSISVFVFWYSIGHLFAQDTSHVTAQGTLPDNHLLFSLHLLNDKLEGANEYLEGFKVSMDLPHRYLQQGLDGDSLLSAVRNREIRGTLTYPNGKTTPIKYEVVHHRETEDIYMKTTLGYFLWESVAIRNDTLFFVIDWWYCPPARKVDLETLELAEQLLGNPNNWHKNDDRKCEDDIESNRWSLFCALKYASIEIMGEYNHHNTAMQTVRFVIDDIIPAHGFEHTLMDYNNSPLTKHENILNVIDVAQKRVKQELEKIDN
ncbi:MAG: hypothetical protein JSV84_03345 [Gemmatimonadota bacterium]|nr:MAG: hypothetical protein JSV84_03345 [Gemmatimonadota bacterium]